MGNCLKNQLKSAVQNDNLPLFGAIDFEVARIASPTQTTQTLSVWFTGVSNSNPVHIEVVGNGHFGTSYDNITLEELDVTTAQNVFYVENANFKLRIRDKQTLDMLALGSTMSASISDVKYCKNIEYIKGSGHYHGNVSNILSDKIIDLQVNNSKIYGSIDSLINSRTLRYVHLSNTSVTGNISCLSNSTNTLMEFYANNTEIAGDLSFFLNNGAKKFSKLTVISVQNTPNITKNEGDIATLRSLGVTVLI